MTSAQGNSCVQRILLNRDFLTVAIFSHEQPGDSAHDHSHMKFKILPPSHGQFVCGFHSLTQFTAIQGTVLLQYPSDSPVHAKKITIALTATLALSYSHGARGKFKGHKVSQSTEFFSQTNELWNCQTANSELLTQISLPFQFQIPYYFPSSIALPHCRVTYTLTASLHRKSKIHHLLPGGTKSICIDIPLRTYTLSTLPECNVPIVIRNDARFEKQSGLEYKITMPRKAYGPGDMVEVYVQVFELASVEQSPISSITAVEAGIKQYIEYDVDGLEPNWQLTDPSSGHKATQGSGLMISLNEGQEVGQSRRFCEKTYIAHTKANVSSVRFLKHLHQSEKREIFWKTLSFAFPESTSPTCVSLKHFNICYRLKVKLVMEPIPQANVNMDRRSSFAESKTFSDNFDVFSDKNAASTTSRKDTIFASGFRDVQLLETAQRHDLSVKHSIPIIATEIPRQDCTKLHDWISQEKTSSGNQDTSQAVKVPPPTIVAGRTPLQVFGSEKQLELLVGIKPAEPEITQYRKAKTDIEPQFPKPRSRKNKNMDASGYATEGAVDDLESLSSSSSEESVHEDLKLPKKVSFGRRSYSFDGENAKEIVTRSKRQSALNPQSSRRVITPASPRKPNEYIVQRPTSAIKSREEAKPPVRTRNGNVPRPGSYFGDIPKPIPNSPFDSVNSRYKVVTASPDTGGINSKENIRPKTPIKSVEVSKKPTKELQKEPPKELLKEPPKEEKKEKEKKEEKEKEEKAKEKKEEKEEVKKAGNPRRATPRVEIRRRSAQSEIKDISLDSIDKRQSVPSPTTKSPTIKPENEPEKEKKLIVKPQFHMVETLRQKITKEDQKEEKEGKKPRPVSEIVGDEMRKIGKRMSAAIGKKT